ncbi:MAG: hypothetical protein MZV63_65500 [Marinilabiliales bacterium]|nr:hypothetical protein [Marinilabiliales bacterium]
MAVMSALYSIRYMEHYPEYGLAGYYLVLPAVHPGHGRARHRRRSGSLGFTLAWQLMTLASFFLIRFEHRKTENVRSANEVPRPHGARLAPRRRRGLLRRRRARSASPWPTIAAKLGATARPAAGAPSSPSLSSPASASRPASGPSASSGCPTPTPIAPSPVSALLSGVMIKTGDLRAHADVPVLDGPGRRARLRRPDAGASSSPRSAR